MTIDEIIKRFIFDSKDENKSKSYIFSYEVNNPSYDFLIERIYCSNSTHIPQETVYTQNLEYALKYFSEKLSELNFEALEEVFKKITQNFLFNTYEISSDIDVFVTFETMNNRGKRLSYLELLKNRLIYISTLFNAPEDAKERLRRDINFCWKDVYYYLGKNKKRPLLDDDFLDAHYYLYFYKDSKVLIQDDSSTQSTYIVDSNRIVYRPDRVDQYLLNKHFLAERVQANTLKIEDIFKYIESLKKSVALWNLLNNPDTSGYSKDVKDFLKKLYFLTDNNSFGFYVRRASLSRVFLLACLEIKTEERVLLKLLKSFERYLFVNILLSDGYSGYGQDFPFFDFENEISKLKKGETNLTRLHEHFIKLVDSILGNEEAKRILQNRIGKQWYPSNIPFIKYVLCEYELSLINQSKSKIIKPEFDIFFDDAYATIEHIYPKNARNQYWREKFGKFSQSERERIRDSIGNLLLVSKEKNGKLGNLSFPDKKDNKQNTACYRYGSFSEIEVCESVDWDSTEVLKRGLKILNFMIGRWQFANLTTKNEKIDYIGLGFLLSKSQLKDLMSQ